LRGIAFDHSLPIPGLPAPAVSEQLVLLGDFRPVRISAELWQSWLNNEDVVARFQSKQYQRSNDACWPWLGAVSSTGHGSFRATSLPGPSRRGTVPAHLFAFQLAYGVIRRVGLSATDAVLNHQCDFAGCTNPRHLRLGTHATNRAEYLARRRNLVGPLADVRGAAGRTHAIAAAIRTGLKNYEDPMSIEQRIRVAERAGRPITLW